MEMTLGVPDEKRIGRLIQVRKGCGQFGSDIYLIRNADGKLTAWENAMIRKADDTGFENSFYRSNGKEPPVIPDIPIDPDDSTDVDYNIGGHFHTGFIIEKPTNPERAGAFAMTIKSG